MMDIKGGISIVHCFYGLQIFDKKSAGGDVNTHANKSAFNNEHPFGFS